MVVEGDREHSLQREAYWCIIWMNKCKIQTMMENTLILNAAMGVVQSLNKHLFQVQVVVKVARLK